MRLEPGMRVRCVDNKGGFGDALEVGSEYQVVLQDKLGMVKLDGFAAFSFVPHRFKPIVRVKAPCVPSLDLMLRRAVAAVEAMTPAERAEMQRKQAESWVRSCIQDAGDEGTQVLP